MHPRSCLNTTNIIGSRAYKAAERAIGRRLHAISVKFLSASLQTNMVGGAVAVNTKAGYAHLLDPNRHWYNNWR